ncbi:loricrin-related protein [Salix suchowensis]|nr:loricrin-related protein [Salix suchowensis]
MDRSDTSGFVSGETDTNTPVLNQDDVDDVRSLIPVVDEGSTSAKKSGGYMASLLLAPRMDVRKAPSQNELLNFGTRSNHQFQLSHELSANTDFSMGTTSSNHRTSKLKKCKFLGCSKGARGASGLCIGHGGGQRCHKLGCDKGAESRTAYCKAVALRLQEANQGFVLDMAGGRGARLEAALAGSTGYCKAHGGGKRCIFAGCTEGAEGSTPLCKGHGGGKRCLFDGGGICPKSVHGGTNFCVAHGGVKRHGGGKRCRVENCGKSAQEALTSAKPMVGVNDAPGVRKNARSLPGVRVVYVLHTTAWSKRGRQTRVV